MQVRCPQCHTPIDLSDDTSLSDIPCPSCGSCFSLIGDDETADYQANKTIGHFELIEQVGAGTFGAVWRAKDKELDRIVAIKIPRKGELDPTETEQFLREARTAAQIRHANIVSVHEVGRENESVYIVSDFIQGLTLADWLTGQRLTSREAAELCAKIADALHHAHEAGIVHRDLKPGNIMLDADGEPYIMDFGLARRDAGDVTMTVEGKVLGTPAYMSPEQAKGSAHSADRRTDIYSLGVILFEVLTGELPFRGNTRMILHQVINEDAPSPRKLNSNVPRDLETISLKCLEKDPDKRYRTAAELTAEFRRFLTGEAITARPISTMARAWRWCKRKPVVAGLGVAFLVSLTFGLASTSWQWFRADEEAKRSTKLAAEREEALLGETAARKAAETEVEARRRQLYISDMNVACQAWDEANVGRVVDLLERYLPQHGQEDLRRFEWYYLWRLCQSQPCIDTLQTGIALATSFSPDGRLLAVGHRSDRPSVTLWDLKERRRVDGFGWCGGWEPSIRFSPDGTLLAYSGVSNSGNYIVVIRDLAAGDEHELSGHTDVVHTVAFSPDGKSIASGSRDGTVKIWAVKESEEPATLTGHTGWVTSVAFSPDGSVLASAGTDTIVRLWAVNARKEIKTLAGHSDWVRSLTFSPDGNMIASGGEDRTIKLWDVASGTARTLYECPDSVRSVAISPDGNTLAAGVRDNTARLWKLPSGEEIAVFKGHSGIVQSVAFSPDGSTLASASQDYTVKLWDLSSTTQPVVLKGSRSLGLAFLPGENGLLSLNQGGLELWNTDTVEMRAFSVKAESDIYAFAVSSEMRIATVTRTGTIQLWNARSGDLERTLSGLHIPDQERWSGERWSPLAFSPDGTQLAFAGADGTVKLWHLQDKELPQELSGHMEGVLCVTFSADGKRIASGGRDNTARIWDGTTGNCLRVLRGHEDDVHCVAFHPTTDLIATGGFDNSIKLWNWQEEQSPPRTLTGHSASIHCLCFADDGRTLFSASGDRTVKVWDTSSGQERFTLTGHTKAIHRMAFSPQQRLLVTGTADGTIRFWRAENQVSGASGTATRVNEIGQE